MIMIHPKSFIFFSRKKEVIKEGYTRIKDIFTYWNNFPPHKIFFIVTELKEGEGKGFEGKLNYDEMHKLWTSQSP